MPNKKVSLFDKIVSVMVILIVFNVIVSLFKDLQKPLPKKHHRKPTHRVMTDQEYKETWGKSRLKTYRGML